MDILNANQEIGLKTAIDMAARKYNIDLNATVMGFKTCNQSSCYPIQVVYTPALLGHKDVGITNCPGKKYLRFTSCLAQRIISGV